MSDDFVSANPPAAGIEWKALQGKLLVIEPLSWETGITTVHGVTDATKAHVYALTGPAEADEYLEALIFPKLLASQTKAQIGKKVVGRLGQGAAKPGQDAPWLLESATEDDLTKARTWMASRNTTTVAAPATAEAPF